LISNFKEEEEMKEVSNFLSWYEKVNFDAQKQSIRKPAEYLNLSYYSIVYVQVHSSTKDFYQIFETEGALTTFAFTAQPTSENKEFIFEEYTIGELSLILSQNKIAQLIKINPVTHDQHKINQCEEIIFCPLKDMNSKQLTFTALDQTLPLMAIDQKKVHSMSFEAVYGFFRDSDFPTDSVARTNHIFKMIHFIEFALKRIPLKFGSSSVICIFLDFDNPIEENQFIQDYELLDTYSNVIFVNNNLEIVNTYRQKIEYNGDKMETILMPIINWQKDNNSARQELL